MTSRRKDPQNGKSAKSAQAPQSAPEHDPVGQSPDDPIEFANTAVGRGNEERANAEPEPAALHHAVVPGVPDPAVKRRHEQNEHERDDH